MNKRFAAVGLSIGLVAGAGAGLALAAPGIGGAASTESSGASALQTDTSSTSSTTGTAEAPVDRTARLQEVLAPLVADGTITQAQADAVVARLIEAAPAGGHGGRGGHGPGRGARLEGAAEAIGVTTEELGQALRDGQTIAEVAAANNVDVQVVIDAMVAQLETHLAEEVASGEHTQAEVDEKLANATERITAIVNGEIPAGAPGFGPGDRRGHHGHGDAETDDDTTATTGS